MQVSDGPWDSAFLTRSQAIAHCGPENMQKLFNWSIMNSLHRRRQIWGSQTDFLSLSQNSINPIHWSQFQLSELELLHLVSLIPEIINSRNVPPWISSLWENCISIKVLSAILLALYWICLQVEFSSTLEAQIHEHKTPVQIGLAVMMVPLKILCFYKTHWICLHLCKTHGLSPKYTAHMLNSFLENSSFLNGND